MLPQYISKQTVKQIIACLFADSFRINFALTNRIGSNHNRQKINQIIK